MCAGSGHTAEALPLIQDVEMANSVDDLKTSRSILERNYLNFETLDTRIVSALKKTILNSNFKKKGSLGRAERSQRRPIPSWKKDRACDQRTLPKEALRLSPQKVRFER